MIKPRIKFLLLAAMFAAPLLAAWLLFFVYPEWQPQGRLNYGTLIIPVRPLPPLHLADSAGAPVTALKGKWSLVYLASANCDDQCRQRLLLIRQVRLALNADRERVQRVYLAPDAAALASARASFGPDHPDLVFLSDLGESGARAVDFFQPADAQAVYLFDPLGNWLMVYTGDVQPKGLYKDLKKLLRYSQIG